MAEGEGGGGGGRGGGGIWRNGREGKQLFFSPPPPPPLSFILPSQFPLRPTVHPWVSEDGKTKTHTNVNELIVATDPDCICLIPSDLSLTLFMLS